MKTHKTFSFFRAGMRFVCAAGCAVLIASCADAKFGGDGEDLDGDTFASSLDCDDNDKDVFPGALEQENCLDDNCDGQVDEGTKNADVDGDGFCPNTGDSHGCEGNPLRNPKISEDGGTKKEKPNGIDDNCNGVVDDGLPDSDVDEDKFTVADGDCNDRDNNINPGALEVEGFTCKDNDDCPSGECVDGYCRCTETKDCSTLGPCIDDSQCENGERCVGKQCRSSWTCLSAQEGIATKDKKVCRDNIDNNCNQKADEIDVGCDDPTTLSQVNPLDYARAIELCDTAHACGIDTKCPGELACVNNKCQRVLSAEFNGDSSDQARAIATEFAVGGPFTPRKNKAMIILSSGRAVYDVKQYCPQQGSDFNFTGIDPDPSISDKEANDLSELKLEILVPTNARSFSFDLHFFTTEYPDFLDSNFNDSLWVQLESKKFTGNISFDKNGTPIRLNSAFFDICDPDPNHPKTQQYCTKPASTLTGTGYAKDCSSLMSSCGENIACGGSTGWLVTTAPVEPGEKIKLTFSIFDKGDGILDSSVLIDNFRWKLAPASKPFTGADDTGI